jgi:hypothetical protein
MRRWTCWPALLLLTATCSSGCRTPAGAPPPCPRATVEAKAELVRECGPTLAACPALERYLGEIVRHCAAIETLR